MNPFRYGGFALMLISHKLLRWVPYLLLPVAFLALGLLATHSVVAAAILSVSALGILTGTAVIVYGKSIRFRPLLLAGFVVAALTAGFMAWVDALRGTRTATWDPTMRPSVTHG
jgi:hypothetical protein